MAMGKRWVSNMGKPKTGTSSPPPVGLSAVIRSGLTLVLLGAGIRDERRERALQRARERSKTHETSPSKVAAVVLRSCLDHGGSKGKCADDASEAYFAALERPSH